MAGLEKFQANTAWRENLKRALLVERKITPQLTDQIKETDRFSLDISGDFSVVLEEKKIPKSMDIQSTMGTVVSKQQEEKEIDEIAAIPNEVNTAVQPNSTGDCHWQPTSDESFEVIERMCNKTASDPNSTLFQYLNSDHKEEIVEIAKKRSKSDGEGECFERAYDDEARALKRLLDELRLEEQIQLENESPLKGVDVTALEDVEPPSKLWETTITNETISKTSPIKMVGLLRPSTIIEECDSEDISFSSDILTHEIGTNVSKTTLRSEVSSSCYETAKDSSTNSKNTTASRDSESFSKLNEHNKNSNETKDLTKEYNNEKNYLLPEIQITEATIIENLSDLVDHAQQQNCNSRESTILDEMEVKSSNNQVMNKGEEISSKQAETDSSDSEVSIIEILSEDDSDENNKKINFNKNIKYENVSVAEANSIISTNSNKEKENEEFEKPASEKGNDIEMVSQCSFERKCPGSPEYDLIKKAFTNLKKNDGNGEEAEKEGEYRTKSHECNSYSSSLIRSCSPDRNSFDNKENCIDFDKSLDKSLNFNDTLEEVEYMMKKGAQYLATSKKTASVKKSPVTTKTSPLTPLQGIKQNRAQISSPSLLKTSRMSPSPNIQKQKTPLAASQGKSKLTKTTPKSAERSNQTKQKTPSKPTCGLELKPFPKLELFKKPTITTAASHKRPNDLTTTTKQFSHIVSPIRAYINNSTNTPLMTTINHVSKNPNSLNSLHELERESRLYKPNFMGTNDKIQIKTDGPCHLPKKAYISSEFKCIVDKRTPVTIPGGSQYQKHIEIAMLPAVLKHEGKIKKPQRFFNNDLKDISSKAAATPSAPNAQRAGNESVGDLSLASGDISMYTIKDARKF